ncbi:MAG: Chitinase [Myxococcaceae bacterium]|nr:Chitinase [Myxococcaceae bacterium]
MNSRRVFLKTVATCAAATACVACGASTGGATSPGGGGADIPAGSVSGLTVGTLTAVNNVDVCIARDAQGVYAMSLVCTHEGCDMSVDGTVSASGIFCSCHGSRFDPNGKVLGGPARSALPHFKVSADAAGMLTIHSGTEVDAATRLVV